MLFGQVVRTDAGGDAEADAWRDQQPGFSGRKNRQVQKVLLLVPVGHVQHGACRPMAKTSASAATIVRFILVTPPAIPAFQNWRSMVNTMVNASGAPVEVMEPRNA